MIWRVPCRSELEHIHADRGELSMQDAFSRNYRIKAGKTCSAPRLQNYLTLHVAHLLPSQDGPESFPN